MAAPFLSRMTLPPLRVAVALLAFSAPISVALDNLLLAVLLLFGLLGAAGRVLAEAAWNPVARAAWLLFGMLFIASLYGDTPWGEALGTLGKYDDLAFVPLFMVAVAQGGVARFAVPLFMLAMIITLVLSWTLGLDLINAQHWMWPVAAPGNPAIFHSSITQNLLMAYAVFLALLYAREETVLWKRFALWVFALAGSTDVLFLVIGRTGYLVLFALLMLFVWRMLDTRLQARGRKIGGRELGAVLLLATVVVWGTYHASSRMHHRVDQVVSEFKAWQPNVADKISNQTSTGERLTFYYNTLQIIRAHPLLGVGTGGFPQAYAKQVAGSGIALAENPHEEYLMLTVQAGLPALLLMFYWLYVQWREAPKLESAFKRDAARGLVLTIAISCLVNSSLLDHVEGLFFSYMSAVLFASLRKA